MSESHVNHPDELRETFAWFGAAVYNSQFFEGDLVTLHLVASALAGEAKTEIDLRNLESKLSRKSLGPLLDSLERTFEIASHDCELWRKAWKLRNSLAHGFFWRNEQRLSGADGRQTVVVELRDAAVLFEEASQSVRAFVEQCIGRLGIDSAVWKEQVDAEMKRLPAGGPR